VECFRTRSSFPNHRISPLAGKYEPPRTVPIRLDRGASEEAPLVSARLFLLHRPLELPILVPRRPDREFLVELGKHTDRRSLLAGHLTFVRVGSTYRSSAYRAPSVDKVQRAPSRGEENPFNGRDESRLLSLGQGATSRPAHAPCSPLVRLPRIGKFKGGSVRFLFNVVGPSH
jgi:hypothetical protein